MNRKYSELVIKGPFLLVKGFIMGFLSGNGKDSPYYFHRKHGIQRETMKDVLKDVLDVDNYVHLCIATNLYKPFREALQNSASEHALSIESKKDIQSANFHFSMASYNENISKKILNIIQHPTEGAQLKGYKIHKMIDDSSVPLAAYSPVHKYELHTSGMIDGDFSGVMETYNQLRFGEFSESILLSEVSLEFTHTKDFPVNKQKNNKLKEARYI